MSDIFNILLVEDNPADVRLTQEALKNGKVVHELFTVGDGVEAMAFLRREGSYIEAPRPDIILLDLNLPRMDGREVLVEIKKDPALARIPVVVLTTSQDESDLLAAYDNHANGYIVKPVDIEQFFDSIKRLKQFWMSVVMLPEKGYEKNPGSG
jgi:two-component system, chemotaxis family, response regulator Rcp1